MGDKSAIQWTDATWNPVTGCSKVSPGCAHCYAEVVAGRFWPTQYAHTVERGLISIRDYRGERMTGQPRAFTDVMTHADRLDQPLRWKTPRRVFVNSMSDLFHEDVPDQFIVDVFGIMALAHWHTFQVLTKRPERMRSFLAGGDHGILRQFMFLQQNGGTSTRNVFRALDIKRRDDIEWRWPLPNVWLGVSVENQHFAEERIPLLLQTPAAVRFISAEPLLGPVDISRWMWPLCWHWAGPYNSPEEAIAAGAYAAQKRQGLVSAHARFLDWVIVGGESGAGARTLDVAWARLIVKQCQAAGVPVFVKQLGADPRDRNDAGFEGDTPRSWPMDTNAVDECARPFQGDEVRVRLANRKGGDPAEWPADLRVREFPGGR
jgi:protein gp37